MPRPETPLIAADILIELIDHPERPFVLIERAYPPFGWAIPGGFVDIGETVEDAAVREAREEVCLDVSLKALLGIYSHPDRDPRGHTVTACYIAEAYGTPKAADDAKNLKLFTLNQMPGQLAFDHDQVLDDFRIYKLSGTVAPLRFGK